MLFLIKHFTYMYIQSFKRSFIAVVKLLFYRRGYLYIFGKSFCTRIEHWFESWSWCFGFASSLNFGFWFFGRKFCRRSWIPPNNFWIGGRWWYCSICSIRSSYCCCAIGSSFSIDLCLFFFNSRLKLLTIKPSKLPKIQQQLITKTWNTLLLENRNHFMK